MGSSELTQSPDSVRTYSPEENRQLTENLTAIVAQIASGILASRPPDLALLCSMHAGLFDGVRSHGGRIRGPGFGQEYLAFGPNRSSHRDRVRAELEAVFTRCQRELRELMDDRSSPELAERSITLAVVTHAEIIRIHPFEDGNGRSSRLMMSHLLVALGLSRIPVEACKDEYNSALNAYFRTGNERAMVDLFIRLYPFAEE